MSEQRYQVIERIAAGGMAEVYRGESAGIEGFRKQVAIKRVLPKLSANREFMNMFLDEARLCAYLSHSKCVQVFDIGQAGGAHFIVMEFVDGADLQAVLEHLDGKGVLMPVEVACRITLDVCEGLAYAHRALDHEGRPLEIVHRDISPHNVLMTRHGEVKLVDFGLAKASSHLTAEDEDIVKGKFGYLAPEVTMGKGADKRVDLFAAGILLWEMLVGRRLFKGATDVDTFKLVQAAQIPDPRSERPEVPESLVRVLVKALARDPAQRYLEADAFARDLNAVMATIGRAATYLDVAAFVAETADARAARRKAEKPDKTDFMGDLILDALHDFSGGTGPSTDDDGSRLGKRGVQHSGGDFVDPSAWGLDSLFDEESSRPDAAPAPPRAAGGAPPPPVRPAKPASEVAVSEVGAPGAAPPPPRARVQGPPDQQKKEGGPFWRKLFGG